MHVDRCIAPVEQIQALAVPEFVITSGLLRLVTCIVLVTGSLSLQVRALDWWLWVVPASVS